MEEDYGVCDVCGLANLRAEATLVKITCTAKGKTGEPCGTRVYHEDCMMEALTKCAATAAATCAAAHH